MTASMLEKIGLLLPKAMNARLKLYYRYFAMLVSGANTAAKIVIGKTTRVFHRPKLPRAGEGILINLGCGQSSHSKFINIDGLPYPHVHFVHRIDRLPMFSDNSVDLIYASHCLEHFKYRDIGRVLNEWIRVLKPGGLLRLSVPDFDKLAAIYSDTGNPDDIVEQVMGGQDNRYNYHYVLFNKFNLTQQLVKAGCTGVQEWVSGSDDLTTFSDFSTYQKEINGKKYEISLNLEARKIFSDK